MRLIAVLILGLAAVAARAGLADEPLVLPVGEYSDFATSSHSASLTDTDDPVMRKWVDNSIENIARLVSVDRAGSHAVVEFPSARMTVKVPLGWYAIDDGERGAAFTANEDVRIIVRQLDLAFEGVKTIEEYAALKRAIQQKRAPKARISVRRLGTGEVVNIYEAVPPRPNDRGPRAIYEVLAAHPADPARGSQTLLGVPDGDGERYLGLLGLLMRDRVIDWQPVEDN